MKFLGAESDKGSTIRDPGRRQREAARLLVFRPSGTNCTGRSCKSRNCRTSRCCDRASGVRTYSLGMPSDNSIPAIRVHGQFRSFISAAPPWARSSAEHSFRSTNTCSRESRDRTWNHRCTFHISACPLSYRLLVWTLYGIARQSSQRGLNPDGSRARSLSVAIHSFQL